jgi:ADP-ribose pyrophosphatase
MTKFIRKTRRVVYSNPWLTFEAHEIVHPNGADGEHGVVVVSNASGVVVVDGDDVLLTRQERYAVERSVLEIVKGGGEAGESALECAQREAREELGVVARWWEPMGITYEVPSILTNPIHLFLAREIEAVPQELERVESIAVERLPLRAVLESIVAGEINDAATGTALFRAAIRLGLVGFTPEASSPRSRDARAARARD